MSEVAPPKREPASWRIWLFRILAALWGLYFGSNVAAVLGPWISSAQRRDGPRRGPLGDLAHRRPRHPSLDLSFSMWPGDRAARPFSCSGTCFRWWCSSSRPSPTSSGRRGFAVVLALFFLVPVSRIRGCASSWCRRGVTAFAGRCWCWPYSPVPCWWPMPGTHFSMFRARATWRGPIGCRVSGGWYSYGLRCWSRQAGAQAETRSRSWSERTFYISAQPQLRFRTHWGPGAISGARSVLAGLVYVADVARERWMPARESADRTEHQST